ncbi:MAG TPA: hypothetical protein ENJ95_12175 [Bacteroidetes bacterium]|nr:hypothetical protein [Bacteroidota bacterium]
MTIKNLLPATLWTACTFIALFASSCVTTEKYNDMVTARDHYKAQSENCRAMEEENDNLTRKLRVAENQLRKVNEILVQEKREKDKIAEATKLLEERFNQTSEENSKLLSEYSTTRSVMEEQLANAEDELYLRDRQLHGMEETIGVQTYDIKSREERVAELERLLAEKDAQMASMRHSLSQSLRGFSDEDLNVSEKDGKIYVTLSQKLLFGKGSSAIDAEGEKALVQLAKALADNPNIDIIVEGHTDNTGAVEYNLDLSIKRAAAVAKILAYNGVLPYRITPAGKGMHHPIVPNTTDEGKAQNRRVEVILSPNLDKLYEMSK